MAARIDIASERRMVEASDDPAEVFGWIAEYRDHAARAARRGDEETVAEIEALVEFAEDHVVDLKAARLRAGARSSVAVPDRRAPGAEPVRPAAEPARPAARTAAAGVAVPDRRRLPGTGDASAVAESAEAEAARAEKELRELRARAARANARREAALAETARIEAENRRAAEAAEQARRAEARRAAAFAAEAAEREASEAEARARRVMTATAAPTPAAPRRACSEPPVRISVPRPTPPPDGPVSATFPYQVTQRTPAMAVTRAATDVSRSASLERPARTPVPTATSAAQGAATTVRQAVSAKAFEPPPPTPSTPTSPPAALGRSSPVLGAVAVSAAPTGAASGSVPPVPDSDDQVPPLTGADLTAYRTRLGASQRALAARLGVEQSSISKAEARSPTLLPPHLRRALHLALTQPSMSSSP